MTEYAEDIARWFQVNAGKLIWLTIVLAIVFVADRVISRVLRKILDNSQIPSASIFVNLTRVTIWVTGAAMVLQPVFGINPSTGNAMIGGEAGAEAVAPIATLQGYVQEAVRAENAGVMELLSEILA